MGKKTRKKLLTGSARIVEIQFCCKTNQSFSNSNWYRYIKLYLRNNNSKNAKKNEGKDGSLPLIQPVLRAYFTESASESASNGNGTSSSRVSTISNGAGNRINLTESSTSSDQSENQVFR